MIYDFNENWKTYSGGKQKIWRQAFKFINSASLEIPDGRHNIDGENIFAMVSSYETRSLHESKVEMHREFIDVQTLLSGREMIFYNPLPSLKRDGKFNTVKDCGFYERNMNTAVPLPITPGLFAVFFPEEGHMPCVCFAETPEPVKKIVIKIHRSLLL
ncbi:MAG: YhcH/YjgK/YiaL family protein [Victivallaceae bacterium]|nr:YhcH/YjgK/YiaL family protein [Victivallaceae bacterium]MDD4180743.1 YhcH/YjgK/YiaL family protein [Victivallaceae bacterium]